MRAIFLNHYRGIGNESSRQKYQDPIGSARIPAGERVRANPDTEVLRASSKPREGAGLSGE